LEEGSLIQPGDQDNELMDWFGDHGMAVLAARKELNIRTATSGQTVIGSTGPP